MSCLACFQISVKFWAATFLFCFAASCLAEEQRAFAVLDFEGDKGARGTDGDWAVGLADFLQMELQKRGADVLERRDIRYVLSEQKLRDSGVVAVETIIRRELPHAGYLVKGTIAMNEAKKRVLTVSAVSFQTGLEVLRWSKEATTFDGVVAILSDAAEEILSKCPNQKIQKAAGIFPQGFTAKPEAALLFYRGVEHTMAGRPEYGVFYFREALRMDSSFLLALVWKIKAYDLLGLQEMAKVNRDHLCSTPNGRMLFTEVASSIAHERQETVVAIMPATGASAPPADAVAIITGFLAAGGKIKVFSPQWIQSLVAEADLKLSGLFADGSDQASPGLAADVAILIRKKAGDEGVEVAARDAASGNALFIRGNVSDKNSKSVCKVIESLILTRALRTGEQKAVYSVSSDRPKPPETPSIFRGDHADSIASDLRNVADRPSDIAAIETLASRGAYDHSVPQERAESVALYRRALSRIDMKNPANVGLYADAIWQIWWLETPCKAGFDQNFKSLLDAFPDTVESRQVLYARGVELALGAEYGKAAAILIPLARDHSGEFARKHSRDPYFMEPNLYYFTALSAFKSGQREIAVTYIEKAAELVKASESKIFMMAFYAAGIAGTAQINGNYIYDIDPFVADLKKDIGKGSATVAQIPGDAFPAQHLPEKPEQVEFKSDAEAIRAQFAHVDSLSPLHKMSEWDKFLEARNSLQWLMAHITGDKERARLAESGARLASGCRLSDCKPDDWWSAIRYAVAFHTSVGRFDRALSFLDETIAYLDDRIKRDLDKEMCPGLRQYVVRLKGAVIRRMEGKKAFAKYVESHPAEYPESMRIEVYFDNGEYAKAKKFLAPVSEQNIVPSGGMHYVQLAAHEEDYVKAAELLRQMVAGSDAGLARSAADMLTKLRSTGKLTFSTPGWMEEPTFVAPLITPRQQSAKPRDAAGNELDKLLKYYADQPKGAVPIGPMRAFVAKFGTQALDAVICELKTLDPPKGAKLPGCILCSIMDQLATTNHVDIVFDLFMKQPGLMCCALRLDPERAIAALRATAKLPAAFMHPDLQDAIMRNKTQELYGAVLAHIAYGQANSWLAVRQLDELLKEDRSGKTAAIFRIALESYINITLGGKYYCYIVPVSKIAIRWELFAGIRGLASSVDSPEMEPGLQSRMSAADALKIIREYVDLPADEDAALALVRDSSANWTWDPNKRRFLKDVALSTKTGK